jgi:Tfp pilus assembly protein FimT
MKAYTLIELLITVTIIILFSGASISSYLTFNENRQLDNDARNFKSVLNKIRVKAVFLEYPKDCVGFGGILVYSEANTDGKKTILNYKINCADKIYDGVSEDALGASEFSDHFSFIFSPMTGNISDLEDKIIILRDLTDNSKTRSITVDKFSGTKNEI